MKQVCQPKKIRWNVMKAIKTICNTTNCMRKKINRSKEYELSLSRLKKYFDATEKQVWICSYAIYLALRGNSSSINGSDLSEFFEINVLEIASWNDDFLDMHNKHLICYDKRDFTFKLNKDVITFALQNVAIQIKKPEPISDSEFVTQFKSLLSSLQWDDPEFHELTAQLLDFEDVNENTTVVIKCKKFFSEEMDRFIFYYICASLLSDYNPTLSTLIEDFYKNSGRRFSASRSFMNENHALIKQGLIEFKSKGSLSDSSIGLTEKGLDLFMGEDAEMYKQKMDKSMIKSPDEIKSKKLFYSPENQKQIDMLKHSLEENRLKDIRRRLEKEGYNTGISVLLYGEPGTGKTESVLQLAKETGRGIYQVDISNTKSCWFGESEKIIKRIFKDYKNLCDKAEKSKTEKIPILLFNEADAIFSKRRDVESSNTAQTENAIQNIILNEMESHNGIVIATTNLVCNLDAAFERRFLFKIRFDKPTKEAKKSIWMSKLNWLDEKEAARFAEDFNFSGGEIDNIARKITMQEVVSGNRPEFAEIMDICKVEKIANQQERRVGFMV